jgi:hypothetical protein
MGYFTKRYIEVRVESPESTITLAAKPGHVKKRVMPLKGTTAELDDSGAVKRGFTITTGFIGSNKDKGALFVTFTNGDRVEAIEVPRKYGLEVREVVRKINSVNRDY